jgi:sulfite reductase (ferredoxin)
MQTVFNLPETLGEDLDRFKEQVERFKDGAISSAEFRAFRVPQGVYEQREEGAHMLRARLAAGGVLPHQMRALAAVSREYGNGVLHVTTRQDIQVHAVALDGLHPALMELYRAGLSTKGGGGNTVRNVTACYDAGVCAEEAFDVAPYAVALTEFLLPDPLSYQLPRKYKIAFSGCPRDCAGATVNDLGFIAKRRGEKLGFAVYVGGGMGAHSRVADLLEEFAPYSDIHLIAEAIKRVFDKHGNRKNRRRARLRFLIERIGLQRFRALYEAELSELRCDGLSALSVRDLPKQARPVHEADTPQGEGFVQWRDKNVAAQRQDGYYLVTLPLPLGDISADKLEKLADVVEAHGEGMARATQAQNLVIRWVHENELPALHRDLNELSLADSPAPVLRNMIACAGASTCKLGICLSRGLARAVTDRLSRDGLDLDGLGEFTVHISGCPNSCGRHPVGNIGLFGAARRIGGRLVPHYVLQLGGRVSEGNTRLAQGKDAVPARNVPALIAELLAAFQGSPQWPDYDEFLEAQGNEIARQLSAKYKHVPSFEEDKNYYFDWEADTLFSLAGRGPGECGAGVFDLIEVDLASAKEALQAGKLVAATVLAARALLVTQGREARDEEDALKLFTERFIDAGLVRESFQALIENARRAAGTAEREKSFAADSEDVSALIEAVQDLYDNMDASLRFKPALAEDGAAQPEAACCADPRCCRRADFRGVVCPLNYVKTKLLLEQMETGEILSVLLDEEGARNVPGSAEQDGHKVLSTKQEGERWRVLIKKS